MATSRTRQQEKKDNTAGLPFQPSKPSVAIKPFQVFRPLKVADKAQQVGTRCALTRVTNHDQSRVAGGVLRKKATGQLQTKGVSGARVAMTATLRTTATLRSTTSTSSCTTTASASAPETTNAVSHRQDEKDKDKQERPGRGATTKTKLGATRGPNVTKPDQKQPPTTKPKPSRAQPKTMVQTSMETRAMAAKTKKEKQPPSNITRATQLLAEKGGKKAVGRQVNAQAQYDTTRSRRSTSTAASGVNGQPGAGKLQVRRVAKVTAQLCSSTSLAVATVGQKRPPPTTVYETTLVTVEATLQQHHQSGELGGAIAGAVASVTELQAQASALNLAPSLLPREVIDLTGDKHPASGALEPISSLPRHPIDLTDDPAYCGEYGGDIYIYHRQLEQESHYLVRATFMEHQTSITCKHRRVLVDWLAQVHMRYQLLQETMSLTVDILDRYLQVAVVTKSRLQLVGLASLFISAKYEEIYYVGVRELANISANTYTKEEILSMERTILRKLDYRFLKPYPLHFLRRYSRLSSTDVNVHHLAKYFIDLSLLETTGSSLVPSQKAAAAFIIAKVNLYGTQVEDVWTQEMAVHTGYTLQQLDNTIKILMLLIKETHGTDKATAFTAKYSKNAPTTELVMKLSTGGGLGIEDVKISIL